jgi:hypothetical protein
MEELRSIYGDIAALQQKVKDGGYNTLEDF